MTHDRRQFIAAGGAAVAGLIVNTPAGAQPADKAKAFVDEHVKTVRPKEVEASLAWWNANISGRNEDFAKKEEAQNAIDALLANKEKFAAVKELKGAKDKGEITDKMLARQVEVLYLQYLEKQADPAILKKINTKSNAVEQTFNVYRAKVDGAELPDSKVRAILKDSTDSAQRKKVWEASKGVGAAVEADLKELVKLRNESAKQLGFKNYHAMMLTLNEQDGDEVVKLFDELDALTKEPFAAAKADVDARLAKKNKVEPAALMPWHYHDPFFQESPAVYEANLDAPFGNQDLPKLCRDFYAGIGLPVDKVIARSDLTEKRGKSPHAFCTDIDREGDVRVLANIVPNEYWMGTMLHELGHAVYSSINIPETLPYTLRCEAHILTTEGVAMQFERFSKNRQWLEKMKVKVDKANAFDETAAKVQRNRLLIFSRWCQVMLRFEKAMYEDPAQPLNTVWWDLVEKYQLVKRPPDRDAPDYASKIHICSAPVYYHNYMMGELFASQVHHTIAREVYDGADPKGVNYVGDKKVGEFMKAKVFNPGRSLTWKELTKHATGAELNPKAFAADFQGA
jgi:peptidyl-dipeptidase A